MLWKCAVSSTSSPSAARAAGKKLAHLGRVGHPRRVAEPDLLRARVAISARAISNTRSGGTCPSYGQPKATEITPSQRRPSARARPSTRSSPVSDSSTERFTFARLCDSVADRKTLTSWKRSRSASAFSSPRSFGIRTDSDDVVRHGDPLEHLGPSASCGITSGRTKLVTSSRRSPEAASSSIRRTLSSVETTSGSFWNPSRGPTSRIATLHGEESRFRPSRGRRRR